MVAIADVGARLTLENNYTVADIPVLDAEYLIDNAIDLINLMADTSIADLTGVTPNKAYAGSEGETALVKLLTGLLFRAYLEKGSAAMASVSVQEVTLDAHYKVFMNILNRSLPYLRGRSFETV